MLLGKQTQLSVSMNDGENLMTFNSTFLHMKSQAYCLNLRPSHTYEQLQSIERCHILSLNVYKNIPPP